MKIVEVISIVNEDKVFLGPKALKLEFDTATGRLTLDTPAMFVDPIVQMDELEEVLEKFKALDRSQGG